MQEKKGRGNLKIALVKTGGTIETAQSYGIMSLKDNADEDISKSLLLDKEKYKIDFTVFAPIRILSENSDCIFLEKLSAFFKELNFSDYDGIIITHGTDTLAYTSAFLSFLLRNVDIPVVITASNLPPNDSKSNASNNFTSAVDFILEQSESKLHRGVFTIYQDISSNVVVHLGTRINSADNFLHNFTSPKNNPFGLMENGKFTAIALGENPTRGDLRQEFAADLRGICLKNKVLAILPYVGIDYNSFVLNDEIKAVVHYTYHAGTLPVLCKSSVLPFIEKCKSVGIDFYLAGAKQEDEDIYESVGPALAAGAVVLPKMTWESSIIKALIAYNQSFMTPIEFLTTDIAFEFI